MTTTDPEYVFVKGDGWVPAGKPKNTLRVQMKDHLVDIELRKPELGERFMYSTFILHGETLEKWGRWAENEKYDQMMIRHNDSLLWKGATYCVFTKV